MRRIKKVKPMEVSLCAAAANRRVFGLYKSQNKPEEANLEDIEKGGPGSGPQGGGGKNEPKLASPKAQAQGKTGTTASGKAVKTERHPSSYQNYTAQDHRDAAKLHAQSAASSEKLGHSERAAASFERSSQHAQFAEKLGKSKKVAMNIQDAISNTDPKILKALGAVAKSVAAEDGRSYTPQAASIIKAVGRLLAPFAEELTLSDLQAVGKAAGLGATAGGGEDAETAPAFKSKAKPGAEKDELEDDEDTMAPDGDDVPDDEEVEEDEEEEEEETTKSASTIAADADLAQGISKAKPAFLNKDDEDEGEDEEDDEDEKTGGDKKKAPPFGQPKGAKAKGDKVAKAAHAGQSMDARYEEIMAKHRQLADENKQLREVFQKTRTDLDAERDFRQTEAIKKSIREDYGHLGLDEEKILPVLKRAKESDDAAAYEALTGLLKSANDRVKGAQAASGIFEAVGKSSAGTQTGASWSDRIEAKVDELMTKSAGGEHRAVVYDRFIQTPEGREMRKNHRAEKGRI